MDAQATEFFFGFFAAVPDPRRHNIRHLFTDILTIAVFAVMSRADDWSEVVLYGQTHLPWLSTFLTRHSHTHLTHRQLRCQFLIRIFVHPLRTLLGFADRDDVVIGPETPATTEVDVTVLGPRRHHRLRDLYTVYGKSSGGARSTTLKPVLHGRKSDIEATGDLLPREAFDLIADDDLSKVYGQAG